MVDHIDHNKSLNDFKKSGCEIVSYENLEKKVQQKNIDNFTITTFPIEHNVDNWGIVIKDNNEGTKLCYCTDFNQMPKLENVDYWIYEVNYIEERIDKQIEKSGFDKFKHTNFIHHNSLEKALRYFEELKTKPKTLCVCHLSKENGSRRKILTQLRKQLGISAYILEPNKTINLGERNGKRKQTGNLQNKES